MANNLPPHHPYYYPQNVPQNAAWQSQNNSQAHAAHHHQPNQAYQPQYHPGYPPQQPQGPPPQSSYGYAPQPNYGYAEYPNYGYPPQPNTGYPHPSAPEYRPQYSHPPSQFAAPTSRHELPPPAAGHGPQYNASSLPPGTQWQGTATYQRPPPPLPQHAQPATTPDTATAAMLALERLREEVRQDREQLRLEREQEREQLKLEREMDRLAFSKIMEDRNAPTAPQPTPVQNQISAPKSESEFEPKPKSPEQTNVVLTVQVAKEKDQDSSESVPPVTQPAQEISTETIDFDPSASSPTEFVANAHKYTTRSLQNVLVTDRAGKDECLKEAHNLAHRPDTSNKQREALNMWRSQANRYSARIQSIEGELMRRNAAIDIVALQPDPAPAPEWPNLATNYQSDHASKVAVEYDVVTENFPGPSMFPGRVDPKDPLVNSYRPTGYPPVPVTRDQRQLGEIVMAEYPYWCSECLHFGHKSDWCALWKAKPFLWYFTLIQDRDLEEADYCAKCSKSHPEGAKWHTTEHCGKLMPFDHPENDSLAELGLSPEEQHKFARPYPGKAPTPLPRCLIFQPGDLGYAPEIIFRPEDPQWNLKLLGYQRMLAGTISTRKGKDKNDSIPELNKVTKRVWDRLLMKDCPMKTGARNQALIKSIDSGWGNIQDNDRAPCTGPDYNPGVQGWWSAEFLADMLPLLNAEELKAYEYQKSNWKLASDNAKKPQSDDQKKKQIAIMIRTRRNTWDTIFHKICHKDEFARRVKAFKEAEQAVKYEARSDPIKRVDFKVLDEAALGHYRTGHFTDTENEDLVSARPLQLQHDFANAADCQQRIEYIKRQVAFFWSDKALFKFVSWIEKTTGFIKATVLEQVDRSGHSKIKKAFANFHTDLESATREYARAMRAVTQGSEKADLAARLQYQTMLGQASAAEIKYDTAADAIMQALYNKDTEKAFKVLTVKNQDSLLFIQGGCRLAKLPIDMDPRLLFPPRTFCKEAGPDDKDILDGLTPAWVLIPPEMLLEEGKIVK